MKLKKKHVLIAVSDKYCKVNNVNLIQEREREREREIVNQTR